MLKQLIQRLLDSRTTPAQAAHSALRNTSSSTSIFTGEQIYTAPEDGFITVEGKSEANGGSSIGISSNGENYFLRTFQSVKDWGQAVTAPVSKGETVSISLYNLTDIEVKFYKSFGGGYNILVRRALSCLRPSFNYLPRSFCKASILTLLTSVGRVPTHRAKLSQEKRKGVMLHLSVVGQFFSSTPQQTTLGSRWRTLIERRFIALTQSAIAKQYLSQCRRATRLKSILEPTTKAQHLLSLFATNRLSNLLTIGGALC